jgi:alkaline phosphatase D
MSNARALIGIVLVLTVVAGAAEPPLHLAHGPIVGHVTAAEARVWLQLSARADVAIRIGQAPDLSDARLVAGPALTAETDFMGTARIDGLQPLTKYHYTVLLDGKPAMSPPYPAFVTAPEVGARGKYRFAFISCVGSGPAWPAAAWGDMAERTSFDLLLMLGDNHYANSTDVERQRLFYREQRQIAGFRQVTSRTPTYAIWDDHDFGPNNSDGTAKGKELALRTFKEHWANPAYGQADDPGVYFKFSWGDLDFFMLDVRYHRSPNKAPEDGSKTALGRKQLAWLKRELLASKGTFKFIVSGSEWQPDGHADSWTSFDRERREIWDFIRDKKLTGVMLLSGDRHFTAGYQIRNQLIEITSGPMGSRNYGSPNLPEMFFKEVEGKLYCVLEVDTTEAEPKAMLEVYRAGWGITHRQWFTWDEVNGKVVIPKLPPASKPATRPATGSAEQ